MTDIVERLRSEVHDWDIRSIFRLRAEAASEIERLRARISQLLEISAVEISKRDTEIERLRDPETGQPNA